MALSDDEQRLLDQMEAALAADDPKLVNAMRGTSMHRVHRRRAALAGVGFFVGLALLILGVSVQPFLSVLGFVVMVAAAIVAIYAWQHVGGTTPDPVGKGNGPRPQPSGRAQSQGFMDKMEERWKKRRDDSGF